MWSIGCIFAEMINNEPLFAGRSEIDQVDKVNNIINNKSNKTTNILIYIIIRFLNY